MLDLEPGRALLAEAVHHEEAVIDAESEAEHGGDVDGEHRHVAERGGGEEEDERARHPGERDEKRNAGRHDAAEDHDHGG